MQQGMTLQGKIYLLRVLLCITTLVLLILNDALCRGQLGDHLWLLVGGLLYPHIGHLLLGRLDISRRRGHVLFITDGMFFGAVIGALEFAPLPSLVLVVISLFNWMVVGGPMLVALGITFLFVGVLSIGTNLTLLAMGSAVTCTAANWLAAIIAIGYFLIVARIIHRLVGELRQQQVEFQKRSDSASSVITMAEQALLAVLPISAAQKMADNGNLPAEVIQDATLLLLDFVTDDGSSPTLEVLKNAFHASTMILERHGAELAKTFGSQAIAFSRTESGPEGAFKAFLEIDSFFRNHRSQMTAKSAQLSLRGRLHLGTVTIGLVQPERLNLDLFGEAMDELTELANESENQQIPALIVSSAVYCKLRMPTVFAPTQPSGSWYQYKPDQAL